jgi:hypothetical protein
MKQFPAGDPRLDETEMKARLGEGNFIFVGSSIDMFANGLPSEWISRVLARCRRSPDNRYLFQSENVRRMWQHRHALPKLVTIGTTIETNRPIAGVMGMAPVPGVRATWMNMFAESDYETMLTIEPILEFDLELLVELIEMCSPTWINIGADSKGHKLPEPKPREIEQLIFVLRQRWRVKIKSNLSRLVGAIMREEIARDSGKWNRHVVD